jgi:transcriptional regulator with XRE-family HTH domain
MTPHSSGTAAIDALIDGAHIGDNLVFVGDATAPLDLLVRRYADTMRGEVPLVVVAARAPWTAPSAPSVTVLDWTAPVSGAPSSAPDALPADASFAEAMATIQAADDRVGTDAAFVFDDLGAVQEAWGADAALELFLATCPRLYRRRSLALWPVRADAHGPAFLRRLTEITQVVVELAGDDDGVRLTVRKADGRDAGVVGRTVRAQVTDDGLLATGEPTHTRALLGTAIRDQRLSRGLSQAELARRVGITPSALSQVERGVRGPGGDTLVRLWEVLGVPFGPDRTDTIGYRVARRSGRPSTRLQDGLVAEPVLDDPAVGQVWTVQVAPGSSGRQAPFTSKAPETVLVQRGVVDLELDGRTETLHEGDALATDRATVTGWANPGTEAAQLVWTIHR